MKILFHIFTFALIYFLLPANNVEAQILIDFSHNRGFYTESFDLTISTSGYNVSVKYTLDGSEPTQNYGISPINSNTFTISDIDRSTVVRVYAYNVDEDISNTHTYIFLDDVLTQNNNSVINESAYPSQWGYGTAKTGAIICRRQLADYDMTIDSCITRIPGYEQKLIDGLMQIPTMAISLDKYQVFGPDSGIYVFPVEESDTCYTLPQNVHSWERKASVEIFNNAPESDLQVNAGLQMSGASTRYFDFFKHSFKLKFRSEYGAGKLKYPLYGDEATDKIESLQLRMVGHSTPHDWTDDRREETQFHKDIWARNVQRELSGYGSSPCSKFFHLFINGLYWGTYDVTERPDEDYMAEYYGGEPEDYDVIKLREVKSGTDSVYNYMHDLGHSIYDTIQISAFNQEYIIDEDRANNFYNEVSKILDINNFIDYSLFNLYVVNTDYKENNWWAARNAKQNGKFQFFVWDAEFVLGFVGISETLYTAGNSGTKFKYHPVDLNQRLLDVPEYRIKFGDHIQCRCVEEDGVLNSQNLLESYKLYEQKINDASLLEFARWGDVRKLEFDYDPICHSVVQETLQKYESEVFPKLLKYMLVPYSKPGGNYELFPNYIKKIRRNGEYVLEEVFNFKAVKFSQLGGEVEDGYELNLTNLNSHYNNNNQIVPTGDIYYTTDGSDPRNVDGTISSTAIKYTTPIIIDEYKMIKARVFADVFPYREEVSKSIKNLWTAMCPREFFPKGYYDGLVINEIHYNPANLSTVSGSNLEFLEIKNIGDEEVNISNTKFTDGIRYQFPMGTKLPSNGFCILASDSVVAKNYYGVDIDGKYDGSLANSGELIVLSRPDGVAINSVHYDDAPPWNIKPDGEGSSLSLYLDQTDKENNHLAESWGSSANSSTPGVENIFCLPMNYDITTANPTCFQGNDGFININVGGGTPPISLEWSDNRTTNLISNLVSGTYEVKIADDQDCGETKSITVNEPLPINSNLEITHATSGGSGDGIASINPINVPFGYTVEWSNGSTGDTNNNLMAGNEYWVTITDISNINCSITETFTIEVASSCAMPQNFSATPTSEQSAIIAWSGNLSNTGYNVSYRAFGENNWNTIATSLPNLVLNNLQTCTTYEYKVSANCGVNSSNSSTVKTFTTAGCNYTCAGGSVNGNTIDITFYSAFILWDIIPGATYRLNYRKNGVNTWRQYDTSLNFSILFGLENCTNYEWYVDVVCPNGTINSNAVNNFTTVDCLRKADELENKEELTSNFDFTLYPNPAKDFIKISSDAIDQSLKSQVLIYDYSGVLVKNGGTFINEVTLNIEDLASGMYIVQIANQNHNSQYRFRKNN